MKCKYEWERNSDHELSMKTATNVQHFQWQKVKETMRWMVRWKSIVYFFSLHFQLSTVHSSDVDFFFFAANQAWTQWVHMKFYEKSEMNDSAISVHRKMRALNLNFKSHLHFVPFLIIYPSRRMSETMIWISQQNYCRKNFERWISHEFLYEFFQSVNVTRWIVLIELSVIYFGAWLSSLKLFETPSLYSSP